MTTAPIKTQQAKAPRSNKSVSSTPVVFRARIINNTICVLCFFLSGFTALIYQICWIRKSTLVFGATSYAISTIVALFFLGLSVGSYLSGKYCWKSSRPIRFYGLLELGIALLAMLSPVLFTSADALYGIFYDKLSANFFALTSVRFCFLSIIILPPTLLMGAGLPLFSRQFVTSTQTVSLRSGMLYGINTAGAALGALLCGFVLVPRIGVNASLILGAVVNVLVGIIALVIPVTADTVAQDAVRSDQQNSWPAVSITLLFFFCGLTALANEILWARYITLIVHNTVYTYTISLGVTLLGIVLGSCIGALFIDKLKQPGTVFGTMQLCAALLVLALCLLPAPVWQSLKDTLAFPKLVLSISILLLAPSVLSGLLFPLAMRIAVTDTCNAPRTIGTLTAMNTLGGIIGSLAAGFIFIPLWGLQKSFYMTTGIMLLSGCASLLLFPSSLKRIYRYIIAALCSALWIIVPLLLGTRLPQDFLAMPGVLIDFREGINANNAIVKGTNGTTLEIDRLWQGEARKSRQIMAAHVPMLLHPDPKEVCVIGIGAGQAPGRFLMYPITRLDCIDIEPELPQLVEKYFNGSWMRDRRVRIIIEDGRNYISHTKQKYDMVSIEIGQTFRPSCASFYTVDFYKQVAAHLRPGGMVAQFVPLATLGPDEYRSVIKSFITVFPHSILWYNVSELLLIGSREKQPILTNKSFNVLQTDSAISRDLQITYWGGPDLWLNRPEPFLAGFLSGPRGLAALSNAVPVFTDDRPLLEYNAARRQSNPPYLLLLKDYRDPLTDATVFPIGDSILARIEFIRDRNIDDIIAADLYNTFVTSRDLKTLVAAFECNPDNYRVNLSLGMEYLARKDHDRALQFLLRAVTINPADNAQAQNTVGAIYTQYGAFDKAVVHFQQALAIDSTYASAYNNLGTLYASQGEYILAIPAFQKALGLKPDYTKARLNLEQCLKENNSEGINR